MGEVSLDDAYYIMILAFWVTLEMKYEPQHDKTSKMSVHLAKNSDQTGQMPRLIWVFAGHSMGS